MLVLSGKSNFRSDYCRVLPKVGPANADGTPWAYKGNRVNSRKPVHYNEIREYLLSHHNAVLTEDEEADDYIGSLQFMSESGTTCIVGQDKDFNTIPGFHHNWVNEKKWNVSRESADLFLLFQILTGDRTDHIPGVNGIGKVKAKRIIEENNNDVKKIKSVIQGMYREQYGDNWREVLDEVSTLLFLKREPGKTYADYIGGW